LISQKGRNRGVAMGARPHDDTQATLSMLKLLAQSQESLARGEKKHSSEDVRQRAHAALRRTARKRPVRMPPSGRGDLRSPRNER